MGGGRKMWMLGTTSPSSADVPLLLSCDLLWGRRTAGRRVSRRSGELI